MVVSAIAKMAMKKGAKRAVSGGPAAMMERAQKTQNMYGQAQQMRGMAQPANMQMAQPAGPRGMQMAQAAGGNTVFYVAGGILACMVLMGTVMFVRSKNKRDSEYDI
jgi:hypothetical protein|tara:strand:+ start:2750 stop:3070 length:321 start_codon:yes stop_codon:yes gene_type:complete